MTASGYGVYFEGDENVLELDNTDVSKPWQYIKNHLIIYFEMVNVTVCESHLNKQINRPKPITVFHKSVNGFQTLKETDHYTE